MGDSLETQAQSYSSPGRCIFCLLAPPDVTLTDEHIIPLFLSATGERVLRGGSCKDCNSHANEAYEQGASNADFLVPRLLLDLKRRRAKKGPKPLPPVALVNPNAREDPNLTLLPEDYDSYLEKQHYPKLMHLIIYQRAGLLSGTIRGGTLLNFRLGYYALSGLSENSPSVSMRTRMGHTATALTVAKIGYCHAAAELGIESFDGTEIRQLLCGARNDVYDFVGSCQRAEQNVSKRYLHRLSLQHEGGYLVAIVGLFSGFGFHSYEVVVGRPTRALSNGP